MIKIQNRSIYASMSDELYCNICSSNINPSEVDKHIATDKHVDLKNKALKEFKRLLAGIETAKQSI